jgi:hypothetical protein
LRDRIRRQGWASIHFALPSTESGLAESRAATAWRQRSLATPGEAGPSIAPPGSFRGGHFAFWAQTTILLANAAPARALHEAAHPLGQQGWVSSLLVILPHRKPCPLRRTLTKRAGQIQCILPKRGSAPMTRLEADRIAKEWDGKPCPHPSFVNPEGTLLAEDRICERCCATLVDIIQSSSHA